MAHEMSRVFLHLSFFFFACVVTYLIVYLAEQL